MKKKIIKFIKIIWAILCWIFVWSLSEVFYTSIKIHEICHFGGEEFSIAIFIIWFFIGFILCIFQHKREKLEYGIMVHIIATFIFLKIVLVFF